MAPGHGQIIVEEMRREVAAWQTHRNNRGAPVNWRFTTDDARIKLSYILMLHLYKIIDVMTWQPKRVG
jgi:hypothetical protein